MTRPSASPLVGTRVALRPVGSSDYELLYRLEMSADTNWRWRHRGFTPSPERYVSLLWEGVFAQFLVTQARGAVPVGLVYGYHVDLRNGVAYVSALSVVGYRESGMVLEGLELFVDYVFDNFNLRKLYGDTAEFNYAAFRSGVNRFFHEEGRLRNHEFAKNQYWDKVIVAIYREEWLERRSGLDAIRRRRDEVGVVPFADFCEMISAASELRGDSSQPGALLLGDLGMDSLGVMAAVVVVEELGTSLPEELNWQDLTMGDLYDAYKAGL